MDNKVRTYIHLHLIKDKPHNLKFLKEPENSVTIKDESIKLLNFFLWLGVWGL